MRDIALKRHGTDKERIRICYVARSADIFSDTLIGSRSKGSMSCSIEQCWPGSAFSRTNRKIPATKCNSCQLGHGRNIPKMRRTDHMCPIAIQVILGFATKDPRM